MILEGLTSFFSNFHATIQYFVFIFFTIIYKRYGPVFGRFESKSLDKFQIIELSKERLQKGSGFSKLAVE
jgi:hypothetical protein